MLLKFLYLDIVFLIFIFLRWRLPNGLNFDRPFPQYIFGLTKSTDFSVWTLSIKRSFLDSLLELLNFWIFSFLNVVSASFP
jgi:hypothetical protein